MTQQQIRLLVIDDSVADVFALREFLKAAESLTFELVHHSTAQKGIAALESTDFDCVLLDYVLDDSDGLEVLRRIRDVGNDIPVIAVTGSGNEQVAVQALKQGAQDYIVKSDLTPDVIARVITNAVAKVALERQIADSQRALKEFAHVAAHDLRAPLRKMATFASWLEEDLTKQRVSSEVAEKTHYISQSARRMQSLVDSLLEYARVGRSQIDLQSVDLPDVLATVLLDLEQVIEETGASVKVAALPSVRGNKLALVQLFQNLIGNALKFRGDQRPQVTITATEVPITSQPRQAGGGANEVEDLRSTRGQAELTAQTCWRIAVVDNGIGIPRESHDCVFAPFRRLHSRDQYEGSGIGLATCKRIVDQLAGNISVESERGKGATFYVTLAKPDSANPVTDRGLASEQIW